MMTALWMSLAAAGALAFPLVPVPALAQVPPVAAAASHSLCPRAAAAIDEAAARSLAQGSPGMAVGVSHGGRVIFARGYGLANVEHQARLGSDSPFLLASVTKQFTAAAVLLLVEDGKLGLDDPLSRFVPELPQLGHVTLRQLLVQTSGIADYAEDPAGSLTKSVARSLPEMTAWIGRLKPAQNFPAGTGWGYSNSNYVLLGAVIERASGSTLADFFRKRLFLPASLQDTAWDDPRDVVPGRVQGYRRAEEAPSGFANADWISPSIPGPAGGLRTTINDLLRWSEALHGGKVIKAGSLRMMTEAGRMSDGRSTKLGMPVDWQRGMNADYGMGVFITPVKNDRRIWHSGDVDGFSTWLAHYPGQRLTIAAMVNSQSADMDKDAIERAVLDGITAGCGN
jgi:CubicO group peptidase (beta-lactamase class C family)